MHKKTTQSFTETNWEDSPSRTFAKNTAGSTQLHRVVQALERTVREQKQKLLSLQDALREHQVRSIGRESELLAKISELQCKNSSQLPAEEIDNLYSKILNNFDSFNEQTFLLVQKRYEESMATMQRRVQEVMMLVQDELGRAKEAAARNTKLHEEKQELEGIFEAAVAIENRNASFLQELGQLKFENTMLKEEKQLMLQHISILKADNHRLSLKLHSYQAESKMCALEVMSKNTPKSTTVVDPSSPTEQYKTNRFKSFARNLNTAGPSANRNESAIQHEQGWAGRECKPGETAVKSRKHQQMNVRFSKKSSSLTSNSQSPFQGFEQHFPEPQNVIWSKKAIRNTIYLGDRRNGQEDNRSHVTARPHIEFPKQREAQYLGLLESLQSSLRREKRKSSRLQATISQIGKYHGGLAQDFHRLLHKIKQGSKAGPDSKIGRKQQVGAVEQLQDFAERLRLYSAPTATPSLMKESRWDLYLAEQ